MKKLVIIISVVLILCAPAFAGTGMTNAPQSMMMGEEMMASMMQMCMPMMKQMMGPGMMMQDVMQMMMDMMNMQEKMTMGVKPEEKKEMMKNLAQMKEKMQGMMSMMTGDGSQAKLKCAEEWLKKAIDLHEIHIKDPKTATDDSQMEMMDLMKHAYGCLMGGPSEKTDPHKH